MNDNKDYSVYYVLPDKRLESMLVCSLRQKIDWCEDGLKIVSWSFKKVESGRALSLKDVFKKYSSLRFDKRRKQQYRTINIGDIIVFDEIPWIVSSFGFIKVPNILWEKITKV